MPNDKLNGSVELLAQSLRDVFGEAMTSVRNGLKADMKDMEGRLNTDLKDIKADMKDIKADMKDMEGRLNTRIDTTDSNMAVMFTDQAKKMGDMIDDRLQKMSE